MKKIQVYSFVDNPLSIAVSSNSYKPDSLVAYPIDVKGYDEKMIEYGNEMISMWSLEVQSLKEKKKDFKDGCGKLEIIDKELSLKIIQNSIEDIL